VTIATDTPQIIPQGVEYIRILPELVLAIFGMVIMVLDPLMDERRSQRILGVVALLGSLAAVGATFYQSQFPGLGFWDMVRVDTFSLFFHFLITAITAVVILTSYEYMEVQQIRASEYYGLVLFGAVGMCLMSSALELVLIFIELLKECLCMAFLPPCQPPQSPSRCCWVQTTMRSSPPIASTRSR